MAKPIPVFTFVFAAYAATSHPAYNLPLACVNGGLDPQDRFMMAWRRRAAHAGDLYAKVGVLGGSAPADFRLAIRDSSEIYSDLWLGKITASGLGFAGAALEDAPAQWGAPLGRRVRFHIINVLDWRVGTQGKPRPDNALRFGRKHAPRAILGEI